MKQIQILMIAACSLGFSTLAAESEPVDLGPHGGPGGGEFRTACNAGDAVVGFDVEATHVITRIAPVCGDRMNGGTYGTAWVGSEVAGATLYKPRCKPGSILTIMHVFWDNTPLVSKLGFTCFNRANGQSNDSLPNFGGTSVANRRMACTNGPVGVGIFGRAGTAIDALGLTCDNVEPPNQ